MKKVLRIFFCLLLFICVTQVKSGVTFKSHFHRSDLVSSHQDHNQSGDDAFFAEDTDEDIEIGLPNLQCAETFNDLQYGNFIPEIIPDFHSVYFPHISSLVILHRTLRL